MEDIADSGSMDARTPNTGMEGESKVTVKPYRHESVFIAEVKEDVLCTKNMVPGEAVYGEKIISVQNEDGTKVEYRVWNPSRSNLAAAIFNGLENTWIKPGAQVLYLGAGSGTTVSHVSDIVGPDGMVYAVEISPRRGRELVKMAKKRANVIPILEDVRHPSGYLKVVGEVDVICCDLAHEPDRTAILGENAYHFLKRGGCFVMSVKAECVEKEDKGLMAEKFKLFSEKGVVDPFEQTRACIVGTYGLQRMNVYPFFEPL